MIFLQLFWSFFQVGLLSFGGGMAAMPMIESQVVNGYGWLSVSEFADLITIAEMTPGPITLNAATFVGIRMGGFLGAIIATVGCILPSCIIVSLLAFLYQRYKELPVIQGILGGLRPAVVALIASAGMTILILAFWGEKGIAGGLDSFNAVSLVIFGAGVFVLRKWKISPIGVMLGAGAIGALLYTAFGMV